MSPGQVLHFKKLRSVKRLFVDSKEVLMIQKTKKNKGAVAVLGLYGGPTAVIHGELDPKRPKWWQFLSPTRTPFFAKFVKVDFPSLKRASKLRIPASTWKKVDDSHKTKKSEDRQVMKALLSMRSSEISKACWQAPLESKLISRFASPRTLPNGKSYFHSGVDLRAPLGTPIKSSGGGQVVYADHMVVPGNIVVIDHGRGLFSRYMHLNEIKVKTGQMISPGTLIGLAGATGRVEAPHLHWEVVWKGNHANPYSFLRAWEQICDQG